MSRKSQLWATIGTASISDGRSRHSFALCHTEQGGAPALHANGWTANAAFTTLGLRASTSLNLGEQNVSARGTLGWRPAYGDTTPLAT